MSKLINDPAERPAVYDTKLADFLAYRFRIINASEMYDNAPGVVKERLSREARTLRLVLEGKAQMKGRGR